MKDSWEWTEADLLSMQSAQVQESLYLEFKRSPALENTDEKKNEIAKDVSAFANSAGGDILYGVFQTETPPASFKGIDGGVNPKNIPPEWIEQVINSNIQPRIAGIRITPIELKTTHPSYYAYAIHIPASDNAPHQASDKRYYKRFNFMSIPMEDYEIRDVSNRTRKPELSIDGEIIKVKNELFAGPKILYGEISNSGYSLNFPSFVLRIWLISSGGVAARNSTIVLSFDNLEIKKFDSACARIDDIRGKPSLQWNAGNEVILPKTNTRIVDINLKVINFNKLCSVSTEVAAEGFSTHEHKFEFHNSNLFMADVYDENRKKHRLFLSALEKWLELVPKMNS